MQINSPAGGGVRRLALVFAAVLGTPVAQAADFNFSDEQWGDFRFSWNNRVTLGAAMRMQHQDERIIDKQNVPGQATFCAETPTSVPGMELQNGDCKSLAGDPLPSQILRSARGGYNINGDDGDLNYDKGDITYSGISLRSTFSGSWRNYTLKVGGLGFYDPVNYDFKTHSRDLEYPGRNTDTGTVLLQRSDKRPADLERAAGLRAQLLEAYISGVFKLGGEHELTLAVGQQYLRWGESTFMLFNNLNQINPISAPLYRLPGSEVKDAYLPTNLVSASIDLSPKLTLSGFYQLHWAPTEPDVAGTFMSISDVAGGGDGPTPIYLSQGQYPEDPLGQYYPTVADSAYTTGTRTAYLLGEHHGDPRNSGQFGFRLDYYADWLSGGTELSLYGMNIHSRLPYYSAYASIQSCFHPEEFQKGGGFAEAFSSCIDMYGTDFETPEGYDALRRYYSYPADSMKPFLEYPEDIHIFGASFNTNVGDWSLAGEIAYSPNQPAQISYTDVTYAALQPAFPDTPEDGGFGSAPNMFFIQAPTNRVYIPDYVETLYRGHDVEAGDYVKGYERLKVGQISLTGIRIFSGSNFLHADQILFVGELAAVRVFDLPSIDKLQFEGGTGRNLHWGVAQSDYDPNAPYAGTPEYGYFDRLVSPLDTANPEHASRKDFASAFAWGYRARLTVTYNDVFYGVGLVPGIEIWHDVHGTSISPGQDFVEDRIQTTVSNEFKFTQNFSGLARYVIFSGGGYRNLRVDRDYAELSFTYAF